MQRPEPNTVRLGFSTVCEKDILRGVQVLGDLVRVELRKRQRGVRQEPQARVALI